MHYELTTVEAAKTNFPAENNFLQIFEKSRANRNVHCQKIPSRCCKDKIFYSYIFTEP